MLKCIVWFVTIIGLLPVAFLSVGTLISQASFGRIKEQAAPGSTSAIGSVSVELGSSRNKLYLSTKSWPAVAVVFGIILTFVGLIFLMPGKSTKSEGNGLSMVGLYVAHVMQSHKDYASVIVSKPDSAYGVLLARRGSRVLLRIIVDMTADGESNIQMKIRDFFAARGITGTDEFPPTGGTTAKVWHFELVLNHDGNANAELIRTLLKDVFNVGESTTLDFTTTGF